MIEIIRNEGCKFYAKLTEGNNVHLIVKDKHNEEVYNGEINDSVYFRSHFMLKDVLEKHFNEI